MNEKEQTVQGGCTCGHVRYKVLSDPMIVHCCHCRLCQRQTGSAFALNALVEAAHVRLINGSVEVLTIASPSGKGQIIARCPECCIAVWSHYHMGGLRERICFIRVGTLDNPDLMPPDIHIFTATQQPWVNLLKDAKVVETFYQYAEVWSPEALKRRTALFEQTNLTPPKQA